MNFPVCKQQDGQRAPLNMQLHASHWSVIENRPGKRENVENSPASATLEESAAIPTVRCGHIVSTNYLGTEWIPLPGHPLERLVWSRLMQVCEVSKGSSKLAILRYKLFQR